MPNFEPMKLTFQMDLDQCMSIYIWPNSNDSFFFSFLFAEEAEDDEDGDA